MGYDPATGRAATDVGGRAEAEELMTVIRKAVVREMATANILEQGKRRAVVVSLEPPNVVGFRLKGLKRVYRLTAESLYWTAVKADVGEKGR